MFSPYYLHNNFNLVFYYIITKRPSGRQDSQAAERKAQVPRFLAIKIVKLAGCSLALIALVLGLSWLLVPQPLVDDFAVSPTFLDKKGRLFHARLSADDEWLVPLPLAEMNPWLPKIAVAIEDKRFYRHHGLDFLALSRAIWQNLSNRRVISGASTITVQVVRLSAARERTLPYKYIEFIQAIKLEKLSDKNKILEIYLNRAPFGGNLRGVEAAARAYFDKSAKDLSLGESALLVALLRGPSVYRPDRNPEAARARRDIILDRLLAQGLINPAEATRAKAEAVIGRKGFSRKSMPRRAWHLAEIMLKDAGGPETWRWGTGGREYGLKTTLDIDLQDRLELRLSRGLADFPERVTAAAAIMDNRQGALLAYVGNARWVNEDSKLHWVDCARAFRSPGSALKPFIYLEAFSGAGLTPAAMLADTPLNLSGQAPRNFDEYYRGPVSAGTALSNSLNAPAVRVLRQLGQARALETLKRAGFNNLYGDRSYGDSLALGGCEANLWQILGAYGALAALGREVTPDWNFMRIEEKKLSARPPRRLFPAGAAWLINECLKDDGRLPPALRLKRENSASGELAFKTGTSHGFRDAWLAAYNPRHTIAIWAGDPAGRPHPDLVALKALGPVLVALADDDLPPGGPWAKKPDDVEHYDACAISGQPAGPHCPASYPALRLREGAKTIPCGIHVLEAGRLVSRWPIELRGFMAASMGGSFRGGPAAHLSYPRIVSPVNGGTIIKDGEEGAVPLRCEGVSGLIYWFVDDEFFAAAPAGFTPMLPLSVGSYNVSMVDAKGRVATVVFSVQAAKERDPDGGLPLLNF